MSSSLTAHNLGDGVRTITFANPSRRNALDGSFLDALERVLREPEPVRAWLVQSADDSIFSSGYDLGALHRPSKDQPLPDERLGAVLDLLTHHPAPSVALVTGPAIGAGCELAAACDFRIGSHQASFMLPPARLGVVYALKGIARVTRITGPQVARRLFLASQRLDAQAALDCGLLDQLVSDAPEVALNFCRTLASSAPLAMAGMKRGLALLDVQPTPLQLAAYEEMRRVSFESLDAQEGRAAIAEKRTPVFQGS